MIKIFRKKYNTKLPQAGNDIEEFGGGKKGLWFCGICQAVYFKKSWHHNLVNLKISDNKDALVKFTICPSCKMIKDKQYEGIIVIKKIPSDRAVKLNLDEFITSFCRCAYEIDPMDRLISLIKNGGSWIITTTENQLANKLARRIKNKFKTAKTKINFQKEPGDVVNITLEFIS
ncbi:MAG: hypothetical protein Q8Q37_00635 [bacterium]|nr:hypothetical protein [bacterium]